jgi:hypothetical protein
MVSELLRSFQSGMAERFGVRYQALVVLAAATVNRSS